MTQNNKQTISDALNVYAQNYEAKANAAMIREQYGREIELRNEASRIRAIMNDWNNGVINEPYGTVRI